MGGFDTFLFGRFQAERNGQYIIGLDGAKVQELFCYLLLYRGRPHARATLAALLWGDLPEGQARQYLRKALWQLRSALDGAPTGPGGALALEPSWVQLSLAGQWVDVAQFEAAYERARDTPGGQLSPDVAADLAAAVALYRGDLLEGWYQEWCLFERERLERMYLIMLDKLMLYSEAQAQYESGVAYGMLALRRDRARERTHRRLIRLHYLSGNRSEALRQYHRCVLALREELAVAPARQTDQLYERVLADLSLDPAPPPPRPPAAADPIRQLEQLYQALCQMQCRIQQELEVISVALSAADSLAPDHRA